MNPIQNGALLDGSGVYRATSTVSTVDKEAYFVVATASTGSSRAVSLPTDPSDTPIGVVENGAAAAADCDVRAWEVGKVYRCRNGASAIVRGDKVLLNTGGTVLPRTGAVADDYRVVGIALEDAAASGSVLVSALNEAITVT